MLSYARSKRTPCLTVNGVSNASSKNSSRKHQSKQSERSQNTSQKHRVADRTCVGKVKNPKESEKGTVTGIIFSKRKGGILETSWNQEFLKYLWTEIPVHHDRHFSPFWDPFWAPKFAYFE